MKKLLSLLLIVLTSLNMLPQIKLEVTKEEQNLMLNEADDWIDEMPESRQDHMSDAIVHAMRGFNSEIHNYRGDNKIKKESSVLSIKNLKGGKNQDINMRLYESSGKNPKKSDLPLLIYFHGGVWSMGSLESSDHFCQTLAESGKIKIVSVEYPLAPESPYPAALNKCIEAIEYIATKSNDWGFNQSLISVGGDEAGGNLAISSLVKLNEKQASNPRIKSLVLYYPILNPQIDKTKPSWRKYGRGYGLDSRLLESGGLAYVGGMSGNIDPSLYDNPLVTNLNLSIPQLALLPPVLIIEAGRDLLIEWEDDFVTSLKKAGNKTTKINFTGAINGFISDGNQPSAFKKAIQITESFLLQK